ncbi:MAG: hypothetical protein OHK0022_55840 [Roseiflexaceae bacterium]
MALAVAHALLALGLGLFEVSNPVVRLLVGVPLVLITPGYALAAALFPRPTLDGPARLLLALCLSLGVSVLCGFGLNLLPWGLRAETWAIGLGALTLACCGLALIRRLRAGLPPNPAQDAPSRLGLGPGQALLLGLALAVVAGTIALARHEATLQPAADVIQLWMLPVPEAPQTVRLGITSVGEAQGRFRLVLARDGFTLREWPDLTIAVGQTWEERLDLSGFQPASGPFEARLYRADRPDEVFRRVALGQ